MHSAEQTSIGAQYGHARLSIHKLVEILNIKIAGDTAVLPAKKVAQGLRDVASQLGFPDMDFKAYIDKHYPQK